MKETAENYLGKMVTNAVIRVEVDSYADRIDFSSNITRTLFEEINCDLFLKTLEQLQRVLQDAQMNKSQIDDIMLVRGSTRIPKVQQLVQEFFEGKELYRSINADEAVAYGAAVLAAKLTGDKSCLVKDVVLVDVTPLSLGIESAGGVMTVLIPRNSRIPARSAKIFSTFADNQSCVLIKVYEGERSLTKDNNLLGTVQLNNIQPAPRGIPRIDVIFDLDSNGVLNVLLQDQGTKNERKIIIEKTSQLSKEELEKLIKEAEHFKLEDEKVKQNIEEKNSLQHYCFKIKTAINQIEFKNIVTDENKTEILNKINEILNWLEVEQQSTKDDYDRKRYELDKMWIPIVQLLYTGMPAGTFIA